PPLGWTHYPLACATTPNASKVTVMHLPVDKAVFFFQAEDGIRDGHVTGVQTCALPIYAYQKLSIAKRRRPCRTASTRAVVDLPRSEERRVGKECRSRRGVEQ